MVSGVKQEQALYWTHACQIYQKNMALDQYLYPTLIMCQTNRNCNWDINNLNEYSSLKQMTSNIFWNGMPSDLFLILGETNCTKPAMICSKVMVTKHGNLYSSEKGCTYLCRTITQIRYDNIVPFMTDDVLMCFANLLTCVYTGDMKNNQLMNAMCASCERLCAHSRISKNDIPMFNVGYIIMVDTVTLKVCNTLLYMGDLLYIMFKLHRFDGCLFR